MKAVCDTAPLVAAANNRDEAHSLARMLVSELGRDLIVPAPVLIEADQFLRNRGVRHGARGLIQAIAAGEHTFVPLSPGLLRRASEFDTQFGALDLGLVDCSVMAIAERDRLPILTFDFRDFRATYPRQGYWTLVVDEVRYRDAIGN